MAVYDGVPSIRLEGDEDRALALIPEAKALLYTVQTFLQRAEVGTFSMSRRVDDDSYIYVLSANGQNVIHISVAPGAPERVHKAEEPPVPVQHLTVLSGMVIRGHKREVPGPRETPVNVVGTYYPTATAQRMNDLPPGAQQSSRLSVTPHESLPELKNQNLLPQYSQYTKLRPSMYSGKMQAVVQALMGLGRLPAGVLRDMRNRGVRTTYVESLKLHGVEIQYDYKHQRTHGITVAEDGRLWLVEIGIVRGVLAMPLPIFPDSDKETFLRKFEARGDDDVVAILEELGAIPTGESFPRDSRTLNLRLARGDILQLMSPGDLSEYYSRSSYSTILGWAFSPDGSEAHNTAYYYHEDGYQRGVWWQLNIEIGAINPEWVPNEGPIAVATASAKLMSEGYLYSERTTMTSPRAWLPFKVHQPGIGLLSHSARPIGDLPAPKCDTPVHVCFINGDFHVVKFYRNPKTDSYDEIEDDRYDGECLYNGSWSVTERRGVRGFMPMMYSNREDPRRVAEEYRRDLTIVSTDLGYGPPQFSDMPLFLQYASVFRTRFFKRVDTEIVREGEQITCTVVVPEFARESYYMAYGDYVTSESKRVTTSYESLVDPNRGYSWRCLAGFGEVGLPGVPLDPLICGGDCSPFTTSNRNVHPDRRVVYMYHSPYTCSDFADSGPWLNMCMSVEGFGPQPSYPTPTVAITPPTPKGTGWIKLYMTGMNGEKTMEASYDTAVRWSRPSPAPVTGEIHQISAYHNCLGEDATFHMTDFVGYGIRVAEGYQLAPVTANDPIPCFIGVYKP